MNTKSVQPVQAQAQDVVSSWPYTSEAIKAAAVALGESVAGGKWETHFTDHQKAVWLRRAQIALTTPAWARAVVRPYAATPDQLWSNMASAPVGDASACVDIWCGEDDCRRTDCFWEAETGRWVYEDFESGAYRTRGVKAPVAWMPTPAKPEGVS